MTPRQMTEPEAWREVARVWVERQEGWREGSCSVVMGLAALGVVERVVYCRMLARINEHLGDSTWAYEWNAGESGQRYADRYREARALAALWLALEAEEEP